MHKAILYTWMSLSFLVSATSTRFLTYGDVSGSTKDEVHQHRVEWCVQAIHGP